MRDEGPTPGEEAIIDGLRSIFRLIDERLPKEEPAWKRDGIIPTLQGSARAKEDERLDDATEARYEREDAEAGQDDPGEPVGPRGLRAGDRVAFTYNGERITCNLVSALGGTVLRSDAPDSGGYRPLVAFCGGWWASDISDVRLIERAPREDPDTVTLRRDDVEQAMRVWGATTGHYGTLAAYRRVRAALGWGDSDEA